MRFDPFLLSFYESVQPSPEVRERTYIGQPAKLYSSVLQAI